MDNAVFYNGNNRLSGDGEMTRALCNLPYHLGGHFGLMQSVDVFVLPTPGGSHADPGRRSRSNSPWSNSSVPVQSRGGVTSWFAKWREIARACRNASPQHRDELREDTILPIQGHAAAHWQYQSATCGFDDGLILQLKANWHYLQCWLSQLKGSGSKADLLASLLKVNATTTSPAD